MLKNVPLSNRSNSDVLMLIESITNPEGGIKNIQTGVYESKSFNIVSTYLDESSVYDYNHPLIRKIEKQIHEEFKDQNLMVSLTKIRDATEEYESFYGVCDNLEQVLEKYKDKVEDPAKNYIITLTPVLREEQSPDYGWRFHKWGEYIGTHNIKYEYLYEQKDIDLVYVYHLYRVID